MKIQSKCFCREDNACGEYKNQIVAEAPFKCYDVLGEEKSNRVSIDACIASEIAYLWYNGVKTVNSCCGHGNKDIANVIVEEESASIMKKLGYKNNVTKGARPEETFKINII